MPIFSKMMPSDLICITGFFLIISIIIMQIQQFIVVAAGQTIDFCGEPFTVWDPSHLKVLQNGTQLQLVLDQKSGSGLGSVNEYLFGHFEIQMKVAPGDTAGTVTSFYLAAFLYSCRQLKPLDRMPGMSWILSSWGM
eukprot:c14346_g1_i3 orf=73-483(+)